MDVGTVAKIIRDYNYAQKKLRSVLRFSAYVQYDGLLLTGKIWGSHYTINKLIDYRSLEQARDPEEMLRAELRWMKQQLVDHINEEPPVIEIIH